MGKLKDEARETTAGCLRFELKDGTIAARQGGVGLGKEWDRKCRIWKAELGRQEGSCDRQRWKKNAFSLRPDR